MERYEEIFGIRLFKCDNFYSFDNDFFIFFNVVFCFPSMSKYNGRSVALSRKGFLEVYSEERKNIEWSGYVIKIPEFRDSIMGI